MKTVHPLVMLAVLSLIFFPSCEEVEQISKIPAITFKSFELSEMDTMSNTILVGTLTFSFIDGDADIGVNTDYADGNDSVNFFLMTFEKLNGIYRPAGNDTMKYQIRYDERLDRVGQNKTIKGDIELLIYYFVTPPYDTIRYDFYIVDRAFHKSNTESTTDIAF